MTVQRELARVIRSTHIFERLRQSGAGSLESPDVCGAFVAIGSHAVHLGVL